MIVGEISKNLSQEDKCRLSILHRNFDFRFSHEFRLVEKYFCLISDWEAFKNDLYSDIEKNIVCNPLVKRVLLNLTNYVGCRSVMAHLLFCNQLFEGTGQCSEFTTILAKIYETNFSVSVKKCTTGKVQFQFLNSFSFWEEDWALGYNCVKIWDLLNIS